MPSAIRVLCGTCAAVVAIACTESMAPSRVPQPDVLSVVISPPLGGAAVGQCVTVPLTASLQDVTAGNTILVPDSVQWVSSDLTVASVSATGVLATTIITSPRVTVTATAFSGTRQTSGQATFSVPSDLILPVRTHC